MDKIPFEDGTLVKAGYVEIDGTKYETVQPEYEGETPLSAYNLNKMQDNVENSINEEKLVKRINISGSSKQEGTPSIDSEAPIESVGDNINVFDSTLETQTINGVTISYDENDGTLTLNGTATATSGGGYLFKRYPAGTTMAELEANKTYSASLNVISGSFIANTAQEENSSIQFWQAWTYSFQLMFATISNNQIKITRTPTSNINLANIQIKIVEGDVFNNFKIAIKFEEGQVTPYSPYGQGNIEIKQVNKNQLKVTATTKTVNGITFTVNKDSSVSANGTATTDATLLVQELTSYPANEYVLSDEANGSATTYYTRLYSGSSGYNTVAQTTTGAVKYTLTEKTDIRTYIIVKSGATLNNVIFKPMIRLATDDDSYLPHQSQTKALYTQQPFRAIGDVKDRFVKQDGVWYEEHNIGELILNGTESWSVARSLSSNLLLQIEITNLADLQSVNGIVSDYFIGTNGDFIWNVNDGKYYIAGNSSNKIRISLNITKFPTVSSFTEWLKTNNAKVYYQLATPTLIECTPEQVEVLNDIYSAYGEGMTNITCTDEVVPVIEIVKETKETVQSENDKAISALLERVSQLEQLLAQSTAVEEEA